MKQRIKLVKSLGESEHITQAEPSLALPDPVTYVNVELGKTLPCIPLIAPVGPVLSRYNVRDKKSSKLRHVNKLKKTKLLKGHTESEPNQQSEPSVSPRNSVPYVELVKSLSSGHEINNKQLSKMTYSELLSASHALSIAQNGRVFDWSSVPSKVSEFVQNSIKSGSVDKDLAALNRQIVLRIDEQE